MSSSVPDGDEPVVHDQAAEVQAVAAQAVAGQAVEVHDVDGDAVPEVPEPPVTGDEVVDAVTAALERAACGSLEEQVQAFDSAHRTLQDRLADVEG